MTLLNEKIKEFRQNRGLTLLEVAEYLGVKEATVQRYESGNIKNIKHETICKLADLFVCDPCDLMGWEAPESLVMSSFNANSSVVTQKAESVTVIQNGNLSKQTLELIRIFEALDVRRQTELLSFAFNLEQEMKEDSN